MRSWLLKERYPKEIDDEEVSKVKLKFSRKIVSKDKEIKDVPLIVTYHTTSLNCLSKTIRDNLCLLYMNEEV